MSADQREDDREKKSWRERDAEKDRKQYYQDKAPSEAQSKKSTFEKKRETTAAKAALNEAFGSGKKSKEQETAWKHVFEGPNKTFSIRANHFVEKFGLPSDWDDLVRLLDHQSPDFIQTLLSKMLAQAPGESETRRDLLTGKLRVLKVEHEEPKLLQLFDEALTKLQEITIT